MKEKPNNMKTKKAKEGVKGRYLNVLIEIYEALNKDEKSNIAAICRKHKVSNSIATSIRKLHLIRYSLKGNKWIGEYPSIHTVEQVRQAIALQKSKVVKKVVKQAFEWEKPQPKSEPIVKYEYKPQPDTSLVSEFIDHHEQSLLPHYQNDVKTDKNDKKERLFQLRIFGINLFTVKY